jgi:hypothetical protein
MKPDDIPLKTIAVRCPKCLTRLRVSARKQHGQLKCGKCKTEFSINEQDIGNPPPIDRPGLPWDNVETVGIGIALVGTIKQVLFRPVAAFQIMALRKKHWMPIIYFVLLSWVFKLITAGLDQALYNMSTQLIPGRFAKALPFALQALALPVFLVLSIYIASGMQYLCALLIGVDRQGRGFDCMLRIACYAAGSTRILSVLSVIPIVGSIAGYIWALVCMTIGIREGYGTTTARAIIVVLLPTLLVIILLTILFLLPSLMMIRG